ncbi:MAG: sigma-70 family RNA polymerase sigma factor [Gammaproteobacteria bacterium]|nr:sigma-70 family RNA polymerase sigma factor [Gammaproteobacteria bacterium]MDH3767671.1 sigma-70 family RNA polymerase sigma factor [Gammaproteobacteria bacterium]
MHKEREKALLEDCKAGDRTAMETLVRQYERPVYNAAYRMLGNPDDAADVTQTTFTNVLEHLDQFNPKFRFFSWIYRIAVNESINQLKRRKSCEPLVDTQPAAGPGIDEIVASGQVGKEVQAVLMKLQEDHRAVIVLRYFTECSYLQIAEILRIPEKTVKSRLFSARQQMKSKLKKLGILEG